MPTAPFNLRFFIFIILFLCLILSLVVLQQWSGLFVWDDAYMFTRYADNMLADGSISWNPEGEASYGLTSTLYLVVITPLSLLLKNPSLVLVLGSTICGVIFILLVLRLVRHVSSTWWMTVFVLASLTTAGYDLAAHFTSGMDTMFALASLTLYLILIKQYEELRSRKYLIATSFWGGLLFAVRPDLMVYPAAVGGIWLCLGSERYTAFKLLTGTGMVVLVQLAFNQFYFNSVFPLPFYAKSLPLYGEGFYSYYANTSLNFLLDFVRGYPYLFGLILLNLLVNWRTWRDKMTTIDKGILVGTLLFIAYHLFFVVPVMGFHQRFYYPTLPALFYLAAKSALHLIDRIPSSTMDNIRHYPYPVLVIPIVLLATLIHPTPWMAVMLNYADTQSEQISSIFQFDIATTFHVNYVGNWYRLDAFSDLPDDLVIATTEVGLPAAMNPDKRIIDLSGLNERVFAHNGFSSDVLFSQDYQPDLIYLPFPHYEEIIAEIKRHPNFVNDYLYFPARELRTNMGVAIRRDSPYYDEMMQIMETR